MRDIFLHLRIGSKGSEALTGDLGGYEFKDGRSVKPIPMHDALRIGGAMKVFDDNGLQVSPSNLKQLLMTHKPTPQPPAKPNRVERVAEEPKPEPVVEVRTNSTNFTQEQLEQIADAKGIAGLREISDPLGIKARSIPELIREILASQRRVTH